MTTYSLDTNAILRYLLNDIPSQASQVDKIFSHAKELKCRVTIKSVVFVEVIFVLTKAYGLSRTVVTDQLSEFLQIHYIEFENHELLLKTLQIFPSVTVSFVDLMLAIEAQETGKTLVTFDKKLQKLNLKTD